LSREKRVIGCGQCSNGTEGVHNLMPTIFLSILVGK